MPNITDNPDQKRFEHSVEDQVAFVEYILNKQGLIFLTHTEVPKKMRGQGIAFDMIGEVLAEVKERNLKLVPLCPTVAEYLRRNTKWKKLLAPGYSV